MRGRWISILGVGYGSSYLPSDMNAAYLLAQLEEAEKINNARLASWHHYQERLAPLEQQGKLEIAHIPEGCGHNAHMFWIKLRDLEERTAMIAYLKEHDIYSMFHYVPLAFRRGWTEVWPLCGQRRLYHQGEQPADPPAYVLRAHGGRGQYSGGDCKGVLEVSAQQRATIRCCTAATKARSK